MSRLEAIRTLADMNPPERLWQMVQFTVRYRKSPVVRRAYRSMLTNYLGALELQGHRSAHASEVVERMMGGAHCVAKE